MTIKRKVFYYEKKHKQNNAKQPQNPQNRNASKTRFATLASNAYHIHYFFISHSVSSSLNQHSIQQLMHLL